MVDGLRKLGKAKENDYFAKKNEEALRRLASRKEGSALKSPVSGKELEPVEIAGIIVDICRESKGVWIDSGDLEQLAGPKRDEQRDVVIWLNKLYEEVLKS